MLHKLSAAAIGILIALALPAFAATGQITYARPTSYDNGTPLPASAITGYEFRCRSGTTAGVSCSPLSLPGDATSGTMTITVPATGGTACVEGRAAAGAGNWSVWSTGPDATSCKIFPAFVPNPPGNITIAVVIGVAVTPAYAYNARNRRIAEPVGFIEVGEPCFGAVVFSYRGKQWRRVDRSAVSWWNSEPRHRVAAPCARGQTVET